MVTQTPSLEATGERISKLAFRCARTRKNERRGY